MKMKTFFIVSSKNIHTYNLLIVLGGVHFTLKYLIDVLMKIYGADCHMTFHEKYIYSLSQSTVPDICPELMKQYM